jgi:hypothetical protein
MKTKQISNQINREIENDKKSHKLAALINDHIHNSGVKPDKDAVEKAVNFFYTYLMFVPVTSDQTVAAAKKANILHLVQPLLEIVEDYFVNPNDLIPDRLGVFGLLDDAYYSLKMMQTISEEYARQTGVPLISFSLAPFNNEVRGVLGDNIAQMIEMAIISAFQTQTVQNPFMQLINQYNSTMYINDPMYGTCSVSDVANARLGAMGVV